jgi:hypothetical protein
MYDRFEATFVVAVPPDAAWSALAAGRRDEHEWWLPAFDSATEVAAVDDGRALHVRKTDEPCAGTEIVVTFEAAAAGTTVTVVQSGFGKELFAQSLEWLSVGWGHIVADLALYLERGVEGRRHRRPWGTLGCNVHETAAGLVVGSVFGGFARRVGLAPGDVLLLVGGAPVANVRELATVMRVFGAGDEIEAHWVRDRAVVRAAAVL